MKKVLLVLLTTIGTLAAMAQCTSPQPGNPGFSPAPDNIPCINQGVSYSTSIAFQNFDSVEVSGIGVKVVHLYIDSILNLPCGISWSTNKPNNKWLNQENGCIFFNGTTTDSVGQYKIEIKIRMQVNLMPNEIPYTIEALGTRVDLRVRDNAGSVCPAIDTTALATLETSTCNTGNVTSYLNTVRGKVYIDTDSNGSFTPADYGLPYFKVNVGGSTYAYTNQSGDYVLYLLSGSYTVSPDTHPDYTLTSSPTQYAFNFIGAITDTAGHDFGFTVTNEVHDLSVLFYNPYLRLGNSKYCHLMVTNLGTVKDSGTVHLSFDTLFNITGTYPIAYNLSDSTASWTVNTLWPGQSQWFSLQLNTPVDTNLLGDSVKFVAYVDSVGSDIDMANDTFVNIVEIRGAYDPNDKTPYPNILSESFVDEEGYIIYRIRFQNTGNDTAFNIVVRDTINSPHLDLSTFQLLSASHEFTFQMEENNIAIWTFNNILLPDSNINEPGSHGYIFFRIKIDNTNLEDGSEILNQAGIYFDFNPVVMTDASVARVDFGIGIQEVVRANANISIYPNPSQGGITIEHKQWTVGTELILLDLAGKEMLRLPLTGTLTEAELGHLPNGIYIYHIAGPAGSEGTGKIVVGK